jgi:DNA-binding NtrC family response regulator
MNANLLVVDDDPLILDLIKGGMRHDGYQVFCAANGQEALELSQRHPMDLAILDFSLPDICGADLFHYLREGNPDLPVIILTGHPNLEMAVELMKKGARDYLTKPFSLTELTSHIRAILHATRAGGPDRETTDEPVATADGSHLEVWAPGGYIFGNSEAMRQVDIQIRNLPRYPDTTVLITGPTGTGKSVVARRIHELTWGKAAPFVEIDCSTIPRELCESELFGHEKGSFTGAHRAKPGLFETAGRGTAFLDEIGELDLPTQVKLLRVLEARQFKRVGGELSLPMPARIIAATNRSLPELIRTGRFREDLYFRLNVFELWMPALKERGEDAIILACHFLKYFGNRYHKNITGFTPEALDYLRNCDFPGNVRELRNMIERAVICTNTSQIHFVHLVSLPRRESTSSLAPDTRMMTYEPPPLSPPAPTRAAPPTLNLAALERQKLIEALQAANGNKSKAASLVGLSRTAFHRRLLKYQARG